ncbi:peptidoglycan DD-metalloendopeptidase family protein [Cellulosimicrobium arenosum]|uniref:Peptidoglycan DD-metalloendopeptidase family protein n=1 Tax=Cellulosimicrobium arenosum TaxID=2708133 RepID=A0A927J0Q7_9MICO|nr:peptidoglycan DD-metalloendopeptidase family protein [Cellulosimicrobium arenosum]MBD8079665.1 peptidoglycan DD-metalloendopeptidase family protein [Cellulosimicrobium arenosum]
MGILRRKLGVVIVAVVATLSAALAPVLVAPSASAAASVVSPLAKGSYNLSSYYGPRCMPTANASTWHLGQDMGAKSGTRINAIAAGTVLRAGSVSGFGQWVVIKHRTVSSVYGHVLDGDKYVKVGQKVKAGQRIADVGSTGTSTSPHLHLEIWNGTYGSGGAHTDSLAFLKARGVDLAASATWRASRSVPSSCTYYAQTRVNLRAGASTSTKVLTVVPKAGKVTAKPGASSGSWRKVTYGSRTGWMHAAYVSPRKPATTTTAAPAKRTLSYVTATRLNMRAKPSTSSAVLTTLKKGKAVEHRGTASKGWLKVKVGSNIGYVSTAYISSTKPR